MSTEECFFQMYQIDYEVGIFDKDGMKNLVVQGFLSPDNYKKIVGEDYEPAQATQPTEPAGK